MHRPLNFYLTENQTNAVLMKWTSIQRTEIRSRDLVNIIPIQMVKNDVADGDLPFRTYMKEPGKENGKGPL